MMDSPNKGGRHRLVATVLSVQVELGMFVGALLTAALAGGGMS